MATDISGVRPILLRGRFSERSEEYPKGYVSGRGERIFRAMFVRTRPPVSVGKGS